MLTRYAVQLLVATGSILASSSNSNFGVFGQLHKNSVHHPDELPRGEPLALAGLDPLEKRQNKAGQHGNAVPSGNSETATSNRQDEPACSNITCVQCTKQLKLLKPLPVPVDLGEIPNGYFKKTATKLPRPGRLFTKPTHGPQGTATIPVKNLQGRSGSGKPIFHQANCHIRYQIPAVPQMRDAATPSMPGINGWWGYRQHYFFYYEKDVCMQALEHSRTSNALTYELAYAYEPWLIKMFINSVSITPRENEKDPIKANCTVVSQVFNTTSTARDSRFRRVTPAQALANELSCYGTGCPDQARANELFILSDNINHMKQMMMSGRRLREKEPVEGEEEQVEWELSYNKTRETMTNFGLAFEFFNHPDVATAFNRVNNRIRSVLEAVDNDPFYKGLKAIPKDHSWRAVYDKWMATHLGKVKANAAAWLNDASQFSAEEEEKFPEPQRLEAIAWAYFQFSHDRGQLRDDKVGFQAGYAEVFERVPGDPNAEPGRGLFGPQTPTKRQNKVPRSNGRKKTSNRLSQSTASGRKGKSTCSKSKCATCKLEPLKSIPGLSNLGTIPADYFENASTKQPTQSPSKTSSPQTSTKKTSGRSSLTKRDEQLNCGIQYRLQLPNVASAVLNPFVSKWWASQEYNMDHICGWEMVGLDELPHQEEWNRFDVAYAYDPLLIKVFLNYLTLHPHGQGHRADDGTRVMVANCSVVPNVFNRRSNVPGSMFSHITPAQALASVVSTAFSPENPESWQFYLLERDVNSARKLILNGLNFFNEQDLESVPMLQVQSTMVNTALAFEFMNADAPSVDTSFTYVNDRIRRVLHAVDQDRAYAGLKPRGSQSWRAAYDTWLKYHMSHAEWKTRTWLNQATQNVRGFADGTSSANAGAVLEWIDFHGRDPRGMLWPDKIRFRSGYDEVLGR